MSITQHRMPQLREPVAKLLGTLVPAVSGGGAVPLVGLVEAIVGDKLTDDVRAKLERRGQVTFALGDGTSTFSNEGPDLTIELKRFDIVLPRRISGHARLVEDGAILRFFARETLAARKLFFSVRLENVEITTRRIFVDLEGDSFDQYIQLS